MRQTSFTNADRDQKTTWYHLDAQGQTLGRFSTEIAKLLIGKDLPNYTPWHDNGANLVVTNFSQIKVTGNKETDKIYWRHSGYPGAIKGIPYNVQMERDARKVLISAVKGMLPRNRLRQNRLNRIHIYLESTHPHIAQAPQLIEV